MITALSVAFALAGPQSQVSTLPDPAMNRLVVEAVVKVPALDDRELAQLLVLAEVLPEGTEEYSRATLFGYSSLAGRPLRVSVGQDHVRISFSAPAGQQELAVSILDSVLRRPVLSEEAIAKAVDRIPFKRKTYWEAALDARQADFRSFRVESVRQMHARLFRPEAVSVAFVGSYAEEAKRLLETRFESWAGSRVVPMRQLGREPEQRWEGRVSLAELRGRPISSRDPSLHTALLALIALGVGKEATVYRVVREAEGRSYRQEAVLTPTPDGFRPRIIWIEGDSPEEPETTALRQSLIQEVEGWDADHLLRAQVMAEAIYERDLPENPLYLNGSRSIGFSEEDRAFMAAYWRMKTGAPFSASDTLGRLKLIPLEELKAWTLAFLKTAEPSYLKGRR